MQVRGLLVAVVPLALLAGGVYWSDRQQSAEEARKASGGENKLVQVSSEDVRKLEIQRRDATPVVLERDGSNEWQMRAPETWRVDQEAATEVAGSYAGLAYDRVVEEKASDLEPYGLDAPAVTLTVTAKDGKPRKLVIGDESPTGTGVYLKLDNDPRVFLVSGATKTTIDKAPKDLRDKRLLVFDSAKVDRVGLALRTGSVEFGRNAAKDWQIVQPKVQRADNGKVEELLQKLADARMDTSLDDEQAAKAGSNFASGSRVATASVSEGSNTQTLEVRKKGDEYFAKSSAVAGVFKISADVGEELNKTPDDFRNKKLFDFGFNDPSGVSVRDEAKTYSFRKSGEKWTNAAGKEMDAVGVQSLIDKLRDLSAVSYVERGLGSPIVVEASVTWNEGKRTEKALLWKSGETYYAQRENEPQTYQLDTKAVEELQRAAADVKEPLPPPTPATK